MFDDDYREEYSDWLDEREPLWDDDDRAYDAHVDRCLAAGVDPHDDAVFVKLDIAEEKEWREHVAKVESERELQPIRFIPVMNLPEYDPDDIPF